MTRKIFVFAALLLIVPLALVWSGGAQEGKPASGELAFWSGYPEMAPLYDFVIANFQKKFPNVKVSYLTHPLREYEQKLAAAIPTDTGPDVFEGSLYANLKFIEAGLLPQPAQKLLDKYKSSWDEFIIDYNTIGGKRYSLPLFEGRSAFFYNLDFIKEAGLAVPASDKALTMDEFTEYAKRMVKRDTAGEVTRSGVSLRLSGAGSGIAEKWLIQGLPFGLFPLEQTAGGKWKPAYNGAAGQKTLQFYIDMLYKYKVDSHSIKHDAEAFELKQTAMFQRETWVIGDIKKKAPDLKYGTMPVPKSNAWAYLRNSFSVYTTRSTKSPVLAWAFAEELIQPESQKFMLENVGWLPSRSDVDYTEILNKIPAFKAFLVKDAAYKPVFTPKIGAFDEIWTKLAQRLQDAYLKKELLDNPSGIKKVLDDAAAETNEVLKREGLLAQ
jgi:multiple sugar transport system substrate-binding protein